MAKYWIEDNPKFYSCVKLVKTMVKHEADYALCIGMRSNGKSYSLKTLAVMCSLGLEPIKGLHLLPEKSIGEIKPRFFYLRRWDEDLDAKKITRYFADVPINEILNDGIVHTIVPYGSEIWLSHVDEKGKVTRDQLIGYSGSLNGAEHIKSNFFGTEQMCILYEEFITNGLYINGMGEPDELQQLVATVFRNNMPYHFIFLIGNTISQVNPYYRSWNLFRFGKQGEDTRDIYTYYKLNGDEVHIVVEKAKQRELDKKQSRLFFGQSEAAIVNGAWETKEVPKLPDKQENVKILYTIIFHSFGFSFAWNLVKCKNGLCLWVYPYTGDSIRRKQRVISDEFNESPYWSTWFKNNPVEMKMKTLYEDNKICFSDNLTGANFKQVLENYPF